jgi:hypothetical protein
VKLDELATTMAGVDRATFIRKHRAPALVLLQRRDAEPPGTTQPSPRSLAFGRTGTFRGDDTAEGAHEDRTFAITGDSIVTFIVTSVTGRFTLGRSLDSQLCLPVPTVSKNHAHVEFVATVEVASRTDIPATVPEAGTGWQITDLNSANGTAVDDQEVSSGCRCALLDGALIALGPDVRLRFLMPDSLHRLLVLRRARSGDG